MNKEVIKKYKAEFDYWLEGGKVWYKFSKTSKWELVNDDFEGDEHFWSNDITCFKDIVCVQDDEYAEFRKALVDGKVIQIDRNFFGSSTPNWEDYILPFERNDFRQYRIKPDEPKFKVGDWVVTLDWNTATYNNPCQIKEITSDWEYPIITNKGNFREDSTKLWQPQKDEWCWFWSNHSKPLLAQFDAMNCNEQYLRKSEYATDNVYYDCCEPFIGELPTIYQEK